MKLLPLMAVGVAFSFTFNHVYLMYNDLIVDVKQGKFEKMDEMHHLSSGMKSVFTQKALDGVIEMR